MPRLESRRKAKRQQSASPDAVSVPEATPVETSQPATAESGAASVVSEPTPERLTVTLRTDGTVETESMRSATREKLKRALSDGSLFSRLGLDGSAPGNAVTADASSVFYPMVSGILYGTASKLMIAFALRQGYPASEAIKIAFTDDEVAQLAPLTGKVIEKWLPIGGKYQDETMLALMLFGIVNGKIMLMQKPASVHAFPTAAPVAPEPAS